MNAAIMSATLAPRSLTIMKTLAMHGMKSVMTTIETATSDNSGGCTLMTAL